MIPPGLFILLCKLPLVAIPIQRFIILLFSYNVSPGAIVCGLGDNYLVVGHLKVIEGKIRFCAAESNTVSAV